MRVDELAVFLEDLVVIRPGRILKFVYRLGVVHVVFAVLAPLVLPAPIEVRQANRPRRKRAAMPLDGFGRDFSQSDAADP